MRQGKPEGRDADAKCAGLQAYFLERGFNGICNIPWALGCNERPLSSCSGCLDLLVHCPGPLRLLGLIMCFHLWLNW